MAGLCYIEKEIGEAGGLTRQAISALEWQKSDIWQKFAIFSAYDDPDWKPPLYDHWLACTEEEIGEVVGVTQQAISAMEPQKSDIWQKFVIFSTYTDKRLACHTKKEIREVVGTSVQPVKDVTKPDNSAPWQKNLIFLTYTDMYPGDHHHRPGAQRSVPNSVESAKSDIWQKLRIFSTHTDTDWTPPLYDVWKVQNKSNSTSSQQAAIAVEVLPLLEEEAKRRQAATQLTGRDSEGNPVFGGATICTTEQGKSRDHAASLFHTNRQYVSDAKKLIPMGINWFQIHRNARI